MTTRKTVERELDVTVRRMTAWWLQERREAMQRGDSERVLILSAAIFQASAVMFEAAAHGKLPEPLAIARSALQIRDQMVDDICRGLID